MAVRKSSRSLRTLLEKEHKEKLDQIKNVMYMLETDLKKSNLECQRALSQVADLESENAVLSGLVLGEAFVKRLLRIATSFSEKFDSLLDLLIVVLPKSCQVDVFRAQTIAAQQSQKKAEAVMRMMGDHMSQMKKGSSSNSGSGREDWESERMRLLKEIEELKVRHLTSLDVNLQESVNRGVLHMKALDLTKTKTLAAHMQSVLQRLWRTSWARGRFRKPVHKL